MSEFASAAMVRVLAQGMREHGLDPGPMAPQDGAARVDLRLKRSLVGAAVEQGGIGCLPLLGRGLHRFVHEPTHQALATARDGADMFQRWQRLERYIHSRHRCVVSAIGPVHATVQHVALAGASAPLPAEDLVVLGVLAALLEAVGLQEVQVRIDGVRVYPDPNVVDLQRLVSAGTTASWDFAWTGEASQRRTSGLVQSMPPPLGADDAWPEPARRVYARLQQDLMCPLPLRELAAALDVPWRTLQRHLGHAGLSYSKLLAEARCRSGAWRLLYTREAIAEVGFLSGYADQPHFTREMQRRVGMPPAAYRQAFAVGQPVAV